MLTVSTMLSGEFGIQDVCLSVPCIVSSSGVEKILSRKLPESEQVSLSKSATVLTDALNQLQSQG